jgi:hypothetical protein
MNRRPNGTTAGPSWSLRLKTLKETERMNIVLPLLALAKPLGPEWQAPAALLPLANGIVVAQMLESALKVEGARVIIVCPEEALAAVEAALDEDALAATVVCAAAGDEPGMVWAARDAWRGGDVLVLPGDAVIDMELARLSGEAADVILVAQPHELEAHTETPPRHFAGAAWFRDATALEKALAAVQGSDPAPDLERDVIAAMAGTRLAWRESRLRLPLSRDGAPSPDLLLAANARLLSFGRSSAEAIERSYSEEFTVVPPVFIHDEATVESSVIASQTSIAAGVIVRNSVLHRCLVGPGAVVENAVLDGALIGAGARVSGPLRPLYLPDGQTYAG